MITLEDFNNVDRRAGTIVKTAEFPKAKKRATQLWIDLGPELGVKTSSAQINDLYTYAQLMGRQVVCVVNFGSRLM